MNGFEKQVYAIASGNFLTDTIPSDYFELSEEEQNDFIKEHLWEPFDFYDSYEVWSFIENEAEAYLKFMEEKGLNNE